MLHPRALGTITHIAEKGSYSVDVRCSFFFFTKEPIIIFCRQDTILETEFQGKITKHSMLQLWPVRAPRPVADKLTADFPLLTGQRILDALFPSVTSPSYFG